MKIDELEEDAGNHISIYIYIYIYIFSKRQKTKRHRCFWEAIKNFCRKNNYVMRKLETPKRVTLPKWKSFLCEI